jgi:erythromycin esterase-like protein
MAAVIDHLRAVDPAAAHRAAQMGLGQDCDQVAVAQLKEMQERWRYASAVQDPNSEASLFAVGQNARATSQAGYGEVSLGQLCRKTWGSTVALVGFTTFSGTVLAADDWDRPGRHHTVRPALDDSVEWLMHETGIPAFAIAVTDERPETYPTAL